MATRLFSDLVNRLAASAPGAPYPVLLAYIRDSAIQTCEKTLGWRYEQPDIRLTSGVADYPYEVPASSEVHAIVTASVNGKKVTPATLEDVKRRFPKYPDNSTSELGFPAYVVHIDADNFYLARIPDSAADYDVAMFVALKPLRDSTGMDKTAFDDLENVIFHGALQQLLVLPERTWSDRELAAYHAKQFSFQAAERRARVNVGAGRAVMTAYAPPLA